MLRSKHSSLHRLHCVCCAMCSACVLSAGRVFCQDFCSDIQLVGSECGKNITRAWIHPASYSGGADWCDGGVEDGLSA